MTLVNSYGLPMWTNKPILLFHGTTQEAASEILGDGVQLSKCRPNADFGRGFYTTTGLRQATLFAKMRAEGRGGSPQVLRIELQRRELASLRTIAFVRGGIEAADYWSVVSSYRSLNPPASMEERGYDVAYGPVAARWWGLGNLVPHPEYDQISFHSSGGIATLNAGIISMESL